MKVKINESQYGMDITIEPETTEEFSQLLRFSRNAKAEKPNVFMSFSNEPYCSIHMKKVAINLQKNNIKPGLKY